MEIKLEFLDKAIVIGYFALIVIVGFIMSKVASKGIGNYFLGGKKIPWWVLGASGTASNFDIAGTTVIVAFIYTLGLRGFWIAMRGGVAIPLAFLMVFLGKWYRRSKVMTEAEFMKLRFGEGKGGRMARTLSAVANIVFTIGMVIYFSKGAGNFLGNFITISANTEANKAIAAFIMIMIGMAYTVSSGLYGVVFTDVLQEILIIIVAVYISVRAFFMVSAGAVVLPDHFTQFDLPFRLDVPGNPEYSLFTFVILFFILKGILEGMGGIGGYMSQRYYAARNEREAGLLTAEWILLLSFRWTLIMALAVMGLSLGGKVAAAGGSESVLPLVIREIMPAGIKGMALAGLIAAAMSTFDSTINAGASYYVKDIYQAIQKPDASEEQLMFMSRASSVVIALTGYIISLVIPNINFIWDFITASLGAGIFIPMVLRWYWERFNGYGFAIGTAAGIGSALILKIVTEVFMKVTLPPYISFPIPLLFSLAGCIIGTLMTPKTEEKVLVNFLKQTRTGGMWTNTKKKLSYEFIRDITIEHLNDIIAVVLAVPAQMCLLFGSMTLIIQDWQKLFTCIIVFLFCVTGLYFFWYRNLRDPHETGEEEEARREEEEAEILAKEMWEKEQAEAAGSDDDTEESPATA